VAVDPVRSLDLTRDEALVAAGTRSGRVWVRRVPSGEVVACLEDHDDAADAVSFHPDGRLLASGSRDGTVRFWRASDAPEGPRWRADFILPLPLPARAVRRLPFSPDGGHLAVLVQGEQAVRVVDLAALRRRWAELGIDR
jgi:WD40 repeat protein